jgi:tetratricopeptide (TPR) repeat protein
MKTYDELMTKGLGLEQLGDRREAAIVFDQAADCAPDIYGLVSAKQRAGINYRCAGQSDFDVSLTCFSEAFDVATKYLQAHDKDNRMMLLLSTVERDWAMLYLAQGNCDTAGSLLNDALKTQVALRNPREAGCTRGFLARVLWQSGRSAIACQLFAQADRELKDKPDWRLNNAIWWMKASSPLRRLIIGPRAIRLAYRSGFRRRAAEAVIIMVGGNRLYERLKRAA